MRYLTIGLLALLCAGASSPQEKHVDYQMVWVKAADKFERTAVANLGVSIETIGEDFVSGFAHPEAVEALKAQGILKESISMDQAILDYPKKDELFHNYDELLLAMEALEREFEDVVELQEIGKSVEGRDIINIQISKGDITGRPHFLLMGGHHAREHLSVELPLMAARHLAEGYQAGDPRITQMLESRVVNIIPVVNPDGAEHDISDGDYKMWRKNRRQNKGGTYGVDLNRNYDFKFGTVGASPNPSSDTYRGPEGFSEPETRAVRDFVEARPQLTTLLTVHTFSELILYPWGHKYDSISNNRDLEVHETMAKKMAEWNSYKPQQSSDLYRTSGDTTDWSYGVHGIISFTFELDPSSMWSGGFYPGQRYIDVVFRKNIEPILYLIDYSDNPYRVLEPGFIDFGLRTPIIE